jgi:hypothetical protein
MMTGCKKEPAQAATKKANDPEAQFSLDGGGKRLENKMTVWFLPLSKRGRFFYRTGTQRL